MSFYTGVVPPQARRVHTQQATSPLPPITPAQAYARSVLSAQPTLQYTIERQQSLDISTQQSAPLLLPPVQSSTSARGQSYAQRLYASALAKQPQSTLQTDVGEPSSPGTPGSDIQTSNPRKPHGARSRVSSLMLNASHNNISSPQPVSAFDFYHSSVSKLGLQSSVPDQSARPAGPRRPQSPLSSSSRVSVPQPHSTYPFVSPASQAPIQAPARGRTLAVSTSDVRSPSPDHQLSCPVGSHSRSPPSSVLPLATLPDSAQIFSPNTSFSTNPVVSPTSPEPLPTELSLNSVDPGDSTQLTGIHSRPHSAIQNSPPTPMRDTNLDPNPAEDVPSYSLVDDTPPPPDFDESQSICSASVYHAEVPVVLSPPDAPLPSPSPPPHEFGAVYEAVPSTGATTPIPPLISSPDPSPESPRPISAISEVSLSYVTEKFHGYPAEDFAPRLPEEERSYTAKEPLSIQQRGHNASSPHASSAVTTHYGSTSNTFASTGNTSAYTTGPPSAPPPTVHAVFAPVPFTTSAPPPSPASPPLSPKPLAMNTVGVRSPTSLPLCLDKNIQPSIPPHLPSKVRQESESSLSSVFIPSPVSGHARISSQPYPLPSYPSSFPQHSQAPSVPPTLSTSEVLSPPVHHTWHGDVHVPPPPPQHPRAQNVTARSPQSNRNLGRITAGIAGGALGLLGGAVLAETLRGGDIVDNLAGSMSGMTFGDPTGGLLDSSMNAGDQFSGTGFDPTAVFQGDQTGSQDSFPTYDMADQNMEYGFDSYQADTQQVDITQTFQGQQQSSNNQNSGMHYMHDAGKIMKAAYKIYNATRHHGVAQGSQSPQTTAPVQQSVSANPGVPLHSGFPNSLPMDYTSTGPNTGPHSSVGSVPFNGTVAHPATTTMTQHIGKLTHVATSPTIQHHPSVNPISPQIYHPPSHHHAITQDSHTQNSYYSPGNTAQTTGQTQQAVHYGTGPPHGTFSHPHGQYSTQSTSYLPQGDSHQGHTAQHPSGASTVHNKTALARQFVKGALVAGGVLAKYNRLTGGGGFLGNN